MIVGLVVLVRCRFWLVVVVGLASWCGSVLALFSCACGSGCVGLIWRWLCLGCLLVLRLFGVCLLCLLCWLWLWCGCVGLIQHWRCLFALTWFGSGCGIGCVF